MGLEGLGRLKPSTVKLASGLDATVYMIEGQEPDSATRATRQYCCVVVANSAEPLWATRLNRGSDYGRWQRCDSPSGFTGFASGKPSTLSDKQRAWFERDAAKYGLDPTGEVNRKNFAVLPMLADIRAMIL